MAKQLVWVTGTTASLSYPAPETLLFSDQEMRLFVDQGMDTGLEKHWLVLTGQDVGDHLDREVKGSGNYQSQRWQRCAGYCWTE